MPKMNEYLKHYYATAQDVLEDMCDTLITEQPYADLFAEEQERIPRMGIPERRTLSGSARH